MLEHEIRNLTISKMREHGLFQKGWTFRFGRGIKQFGCCNYTKKQISISKPLGKLNNKERVELTVLHEIAHALVGSGHGHGYIWKRKCIEIGGDGEARYSSKEVAQPKDTHDHVTIGGQHYKTGDEIYFNSRKYGGKVKGLFKGFKPRNHKYPYLVEYRDTIYKMSLISLLTD